MILTASEKAELRGQTDLELKSLHNVILMGRSCICVGDAGRTEAIMAVTVDELEARGIVTNEKELLD